MIYLQSTEKPPYRALLVPPLLEDRLRMFADIQRLPETAEIAFAVGRVSATGTEVFDLGVGVEIFRRDLPPHRPTLLVLTPIC